MPDGYVIPTERRSFLYRWRWPLAFAAMTITAIVLPWFAVLGPRVVVYPTTDFAHLPVSAATSNTPTAPESCVSVRNVNDAPELVDQTCGSSASTFRVIARVSDASQCVPDADITYSWSSGPVSGAVCLDYDWAADQCLQITDDAVSKVDCANDGAVRPEKAVIGAVDVSYCQEGGIAHAVRHFTICTVAGNKDCDGRTSGT
jgi:hypothetical protein